MSATAGIVIAGAGLAAARTAEELRRCGYDGALTLIGSERHPPYDRPPLSKAVLLGADVGETTLKDPEFYSDNAIELRLSVTATGVDASARSLLLSDGTAVTYRDLVIATGLSPKTPPAQWDSHGVHVLRTREDSLALRVQATRARSAVVIGGGFIGCEVAAALRTRGLAVTLVEPRPTPLYAALGPVVGELVAELHRDRGVTVHCGVGVVGVYRNDGGHRTRLANGADIDSDLVVAGLGSTPNTAWLNGSGIPIDDGVPCDEVGRTTVPGVWSVGDVAAWRAADHIVRREHWSNAIEQSRIVAAALTGRAAPPARQAPYLWSDQHDVKIQVLGEPGPQDRVHLVERAGFRFLALYERAGALSGVAGAGMAGAVMKLRTRVAEGAPIGAVLPGPG